jgi:hypothetical protein
MNARSLSVEHNGVTYNGKLGEVTSTSLGYEDHGVLTAMLHLSLEGSSGIGVGGYVLDKNVDGQREGTAYGLDHLIRILKTIGVDRWEHLKGQKLIVLFDGEPGGSTWGSRAVGIASLLKDDVLVFAEHADAWRARQQEVDA